MYLVYHKHDVGKAFFVRVCEDGDVEHHSGVSPMVDAAAEKDSDWWWRQMVIPHCVPKSWPASTGKKEPGHD